MSEPTATQPPKTLPKFERNTDLIKLKIKANTPSGQLVANRLNELAEALNATQRHIVLMTAIVNQHSKTLEAMDSDLTQIFTTTAEIKKALKPLISGKKPKPDPILTQIAEQIAALESIVTLHGERLASLTSTIATLNH